MKIFVTTKQSLGWVPEEPVKLYAAHDTLDAAIDWLPASSAEISDKYELGSVNALAIYQADLNAERIQYVIHEVELNPVV